VGPSVDVGYSYSWPIYDVHYDVLRQGQAIKWTESFKGPDYFWWPWYEEPSAVIEFHQWSNAEPQSLSNHESN